MPTPHATSRYEDSVFINCPFDPQYAPLFRALIFAVLDCNFTPRSALEVVDAAENRLAKITRIIGECKYGIHDISRTELSAQQLPRFNMPLELGIFLGSRAFGDKRQRLKNCLILDRKPFRYQQFISDIAGQDIQYHANKPQQAILEVRNWLNTVAPGSPIPGGQEIGQRFKRFNRQLPLICARFNLSPDNLTFVDYQYVVGDWLRLNSW